MTENTNTPKGGKKPKTAPTLDTAPDAAQAIEVGNYERLTFGDDKLRAFFVQGLPIRAKRFIDDGDLGIRKDGTVAQRDEDGGFAVIGYAET